MRRLLGIALALLAGPVFAQGQPVLAQGTATLVADTMTATEDGRLTADGNVEAYYDGTTLSAAGLVYDRNAGNLTIEGPILIRDPAGTIVSADAAELDPQLRNGILRGARLVLDRRLQLAAVQIDRREGRTTTLTGAAATSCQVCGLGPPLWDIQASRVVHDEVERQIYFDDARFRIRGVPVVWLPWLRLPDPTNTRASGLLIPAIRTSAELGYGLQIPYFLALGPSRDVTITPYLATRTRTIDVQYRQAFARGEIGFSGGVGRDQVEGWDLRGFGLLRGRFDIGTGTVLSFSGLAISDEDYLSDHGLSDDDRLESTLALTRVVDRSVLEADLRYYRSLREDEVEGSLPPIVGRLDWNRRIAARGGTLTLEVGADAFERWTDGTGEASRDMARISAAAGWQREWVLAAGLLADVEGRLALDAYGVRDDPEAEQALTRATPAAAVTLRWPLLRARSGGGDLIEPIVSLGWSAPLGERPPNEDSQLVEFDEANLHALTRQPGEDGEEAGGRLSYGVAWTRQGAGASTTLALGRLVRTDESDASDASGLEGLASDTLLSARVDMGRGVSLAARTLLDGGLVTGLDYGKSEARLAWAVQDVTAQAAYLYLPADLGEERTRSAAEWSVDAQWRASERWSLSAGGRYDVGNNSAARANAGVVWRNECVEVDVSVARRYTSSDSQEPSTSFGLAISLDGFSAGGRAPIAPTSCRR